MRTPVALYVLALLVRGTLVALHGEPAYPDSFYYVDVARSIGAGHGFNVDFVWLFVEVGHRIPTNPHLPVASNAFWMPLSSLVQLPTIWLLGPTPLASAIPFALIGALAAPLTWLIAREAATSAAVALTAGIVAAIPAAVAVYMSQPDGFALYQVLGAAALWLAARGLKGHGRSFVLAGLCVGLASLTRNDGPLLGLAIAIVFAADRTRAWRSRRAGTPRRPAISWRAAVGCLALFGLVMAPWYVRQVAVFGAPVPSLGGSLFVTSYDQVDSVASTPSLGSLLAQGIGPLLVSRLLGLAGAIAIFAGLVYAVGLVPFVVVGAWARRRTADFAPFFVYAAVLFAATALLFAVYVPWGTFLHSAVALGPASYVLGAEGVAIAVAWLARRRRGWHVQRAQRLFLGGAAACIALNAAAYALIVDRGWDAERADRTALAAALDARGAAPSDLVLSSDPAGIRYYTGHGGVVTPNDSLAVVRQAAQAYGARWLVLERRHIAAPLGPVLAADARPDWIGQAVFEVPPRDAANRGGPADLALYPICLSAADARCGGAR